MIISDKIKISLQIQKFINILVQSVSDDHTLYIEVCTSVFKLQ